MLLIAVPTVYRSTEYREGCPQERRETSAVSRISRERLNLSRGEILHCGRT